MNGPDSAHRAAAEHRDAEHRGDLGDHDGRTHDGHRPDGPPGSPFDGDDARRLRAPDLHEIVAPFVAWLATQDLDEAARRGHREAVERFLQWSIADHGPARGRRRRYEHHLGQHDPAHLVDARAGLGWWDDHRRLLALTVLPTDHHSGRHSGQS